MPNYNRNYSLSEFDPILEKYGELLEIRKEVESLTGEKAHSRILAELRRRITLEASEALETSGMSFSCPPHMYLGLTPNKQQVVKDSWNSEVRKLRNSGIRDSSLKHLVLSMGEKDSIEQVRDFLRDRKNFFLESKEEKSNLRTFKGTQNT
jgi:hypothetical protein